MYSFFARDNLKQRIQTLLSQREKTFSQFLAAFLKSTLNFEHFQQNITLIADVFSKLQSPKRVIRQMSEKSRFRGPFQNQYRKQAQTLFQSGRRHLYDIY